MVDKLVVFKPLQKVQETQQLEKLDNTDIVNFKERGVEFQGYSKVKTGNKEYKLLKQEYNDNFNLFGWTASNASLTLDVNTEVDTKTFYIDNLLLTAVVDKPTLFYICELDGSLMNLFYCSATDPTSNKMDIHFKTPFPFTKQRLEIVPLDPATGLPLVITGIVVLNYYGYNEQKS